MRALVQRVASADASYGEGGRIISSIGRGLCVLIGISRDDTTKDIDYTVRKILNLRLFPDDESDSSKFVKSVRDLQLEILCLSQITLYHSMKGNKLDFHHAMAPAQSKTFYGQFLQKLRDEYDAELVKEGAFAEHLVVGIRNDGPVTVMFESPKVSPVEEQTVPDLDC